MSNLIIKTLFFIVVSKIIALFGRMLCDNIWTYNIDKCSPILIIEAVCVLTFPLLPMMLIFSIYLIPKQVSRKVLVYCTIFGFLNYMCYGVFLTTGLTNLRSKIDEHCNNKTIDQNVIVYFDYFGLILFVCEIIAACVYFYQLKIYKNKEENNISSYDL